MVTFLFHPTLPAAVIAFLPTTPFPGAPDGPTGNATALMNDLASFAVARSLDPASHMQRFEHDQGFFGAHAELVDDDGERLCRFGHDRWRRQDSCLASSVLRGRRSRHRVRAINH